MKKINILLNFHLKKKHLGAAFGDVSAETCAKYSKIILLLLHYVRFQNQVKYNVHNFSELT